MTVAIIPAAGRSTRMGRPKLSLPLGEKSVLEHVIAALHAGGCPDVLVVVGPHVRELEPLARSAGAEVCLLEVETPEMRATVEQGWRWWENRRNMRDEEAWYLIPADHPVLGADIVALLERVRLGNPGKTVVIPTYQGRRGHPALIAWGHVAAMRALPEGTGLNHYLRQHAEQTLEVPVDSPGVLLDLDTPAEYERLREEFNAGMVRFSDASVRRR